jgi:hypothetical protein
MLIPGGDSFATIVTEVVKNISRIYLPVIIQKKIYIAFFIRNNRDNINEEQKK